MALFEGARPYACALLRAGQTRGVEEMARLVLCAQTILEASQRPSVKRFWAMFHQRLKCDMTDFIEIFAAKSQIFASFLRLVIRNKRLFALEDMMHIFLDLIRRSQGVLNVTVSSVQPLEKSFEGHLIQTLESLLHKKVQPTFRLVPNLLGGFTVETADGFKIDASLQSKLNTLRKQVFYGY